MSYTIESETVHGLTVRIIPDEEPSSPREWDNLGRMVCAHPRYTLGDEQITPGRYESEAQLVADLVETHGARVVLPLYLLDHSGITMRVGGGNVTRGTAFVSDPGGWDTSMVGFILDTAENRKNLGTPDDATDEEIIEALKGEVETYATYLEGGVVAYLVEDEDGTVLDSCHGFYSIEDALGEGRDMAEHFSKVRTIRVEDGVVVCPACDTGGQVREVGTIVQTQELQAETAPDGSSVYVETGHTETAWDAYEQTGYDCRSCGATDLVLPDELRP